MGAGDARALVGGVMGWRARVVDVARFALRPTYVRRSMAMRPGYASALALLLGLNLLLLPLVRVLIEVALGPSGVLPDSAVEDTLGLRQVLEYVVLAPLLEETLFRGWLSGRRASLRFVAYGAVALGLLLAGFLLAPDIRRILTLAAVAAVFAGLVHWSLTRHRDRAVSGWFIRHFRWIVWGSSLVFGLIHLGRFEALAHPLGVLVVLPLMLGGMLLAYTRTRLGLRAAMVQHGCYNAVLVGLALSGA